MCSLIVCGVLMFAMVSGTEKSSLNSVSYFSKDFLQPSFLRDHLTFEHTSKSGKKVRLFSLICLAYINLCICSSLKRCWKLVAIGKTFYGNFLCLVTGLWWLSACARLNLERGKFIFKYKTLCIFENIKICTGTRSY